MSPAIKSFAFFLIAIALCSWHLDAGRNANTLSRSAMVAAIVEHRTLRIDAYHELTEDKALVDGHYYSEKAPLPALLVVPFWYAANRFGWITPGDHGILTEGLLRVGGFLCGSVPLALLSLIAYRRLRNSPLPLPRAWLALLPFLGSFLFVYSGSFHGHLLAALFLVVAWLMRRSSHHVLSAMAASAAVLCEYSLFVFPLAWLLQDLTQRRWKPLAAQIFGGLPGLLLLGFMNLLVTGSPLTLPYAEVAAHVNQSGGFLGLGTPAISGLHGLLFSNFRGLFSHAPATIICAIVALLAMRQQGWRWTLLHPLILPSVALVLIIAGHSMWWGGWAFGPRHLTSVAALLLIAGIPRLPDKPWADGALVWLTALGLCISLAAKATTWYSLPTDVVQPFREMILPQVLQRSFTESQWPVAVGFSPVMGTFLFVLAFIFGLRVLARSSSTA
ncbi:MAG: hypothetical protein IPM46_05755 [Flavobacteriales bacterium]|nr:hypothetical protein [Flavobacteriales bacterium]